ncbi:hypothetical protein B0H14DRAFT_3779136 [Mycena olivaceomarginata]|nr:hypothetical protein B0H14DRAFT_3779136 [Mycena olivaceomarginata]
MFRAKSARQNEEDPHEMRHNPTCMSPRTVRKCTMRCRKEDLHSVFYRARIPECPLNELRSVAGDDGFHGFTCDPATAGQGSLFLEHKQYLGIGTCKTAHPGHLSLVHLATLLSKDYANPTGFVIGRLTPIDEFRNTLMEANVLLWATSIITHSKFTISRSYLLEEVIDEGKDGFHKLINNGDAMPVPRMTADPSLSALAEFISFTQHVQYYKTDGAVIFLTSRSENNPNLPTMRERGQGRGRGRNCARSLTSGSEMSDAGRMREGVGKEASSGPEPRCCATLVASV